MSLLSCLVLGQGSALAQPQQPCEQPHGSEPLWGWERQPWFLSCVSACTAVLRDAEGLLLPCWQREGLPARFLSEGRWPSQLAFFPGAMQSLPWHFRGRCLLKHQAWRSSLHLRGRMVAGDGRGAGQSNNAVGSLSERAPAKAQQQDACAASSPPSIVQGELVLQEMTTLWELARCSGLECDG